MSLLMMEAMRGPWFVCLWRVFMSMRPARRVAVLVVLLLSLPGCAGESSPSSSDEEGVGAAALLAAGINVDGEGNSRKSYGSDSVLEVLLLTVEEANPAEPGWQAALGDYGISITSHTSLAGTVPSTEELAALAEAYDVILVAGAGVAEAYGAMEWNGLETGLVTTEASLANEDHWKWLDVGKGEPRTFEGRLLTVEDPHSALYGLSVGDGATLDLAASDSRVVFQGYGRDSQGATDRGFVALSFEAEDELFQQFILWEPGPFYEGGTEQGAGRRALFGLKSGEGFAPGEYLSEQGKQLLRQTLEWASRKGEPRRPTGSFDPVGLLLTWQKDPTTTMTIDWHTLPEEAHRGSRIRYWADGHEVKRQALGRSHSFPHSDRTIRRVRLEGLEPDKLYLFDFGENSRVFRFRTMPAHAQRPIHFITGGDVRHTMEMMIQTSSEAHRHSPAFIAWGGDLAYDDGKAEHVERWYEWFEAMKVTLINGEGRVIPLIVSIGNHEVFKGYYARHRHYTPTDSWRHKLAPFFYDLFAFPGQPGYGVLDFGDYMSWVILDTDHTNPVDGVQRAWLSEVLEARRGVAHVFPLYHVPAYPSVRSFTTHPRSTDEVLPWMMSSLQRRQLGDNRPTRVREHFVPLFEAHNVRTAFESHDHTYKRTRAIRGGVVSADGIVYLGDGAWGVRTRVPKTPEQAWYLEKSAGVRHFIVGTIEGEGQLFRAFDEQGRLFDAVRR